MLQLMQTGGGMQTPSGSANQVYATPNGSSGSNSNRALVAADLPAQATAAQLTAAGQGGFYSNGILTPNQIAPLANNAWGSIQGANVLRVFMFVLPVAITIRKVVMTVGSTTASGKICAFGIWSAD